MSNLRDVKDDLLKDWLLFREDEISTLSCDEDKKHWVYFDEISKKILDSIPKQNRAFVQKQLNILDDNFMDYGKVNIKLMKNYKVKLMKKFNIDFPITGSKNQLLDFFVFSIF